MGTFPVTALMLLAPTIRATQLRRLKHRTHQGSDITLIFWPLQRVATFWIRPLQGFALYELGVVVGSVRAELRRTSRARFTVSGQNIRRRQR
jgi:hypothetical protein